MTPIRNHSVNVIANVTIILLLTSSGVTGNNSSLSSPSPQPLTPAPRNCYTDPLELIICSPLINQGPLWPHNQPCCGLLGLIGIELDTCLCLALKSNILGWSIDMPVALDLILSFCQFTIAPAFRC